MSETLYRLNTSGLSSEDFGGEMVAVNFETGQYYGINGAAVALWTLLHQPMSKAAATQRIREIYTAIPEHVAHDVNSFFEELIKQGLLLSGSAGDLDVQAEPVSSDALTPLAGTADPAHRTLHQRIQGARAGCPDARRLPRNGRPPRPCRVGRRR